VQQLSDPDVLQAQAMLLLTATPMQLDRFELYSLIELLDPTLFPTIAALNEHIEEIRGLNALADGVRRWEALGERERSNLSADLAELLSEGAEPVRRFGETNRTDFLERLEARHRLSQVMVRNRKRVVGGFMPRVAAIWEVDQSPAERSAYEAVTAYVQTGFA